MVTAARVDVHWEQSSTLFLFLLLILFFFLLFRVFNCTPHAYNMCVARKLKLVLNAGCGKIKLHGLYIVLGG